MIKEITVICDDPSHPTKLAKVARFRRSFGHWHDGGSGAYHDDKGVMTFTTDKSATTVLSDDRPTKEAIALEERQPYRRSHTVVCTLCGDPVSVRGEKLDPVLDRLVVNDIGEITLTGLRAIVSSS